MPAANSTAAGISPGHFGLPILVIFWDEESAGFTGNCGL